MSTIKVDTIATRTGSGNITASNTIAGTSATLSGTLGVTGTSTLSGALNMSSSHIQFSGNVSLPNVGAALFRPAADTIAFGINNGQRVSVNQHGLLFGTDTAAANALDDYEEGTYSPTLSGASGGAWVTNVSGSYTKIGKQVSVRIKIVNPGSSYNNLSGTWQFTLPFTVSSSETYTGGWVNWARYIPSGGSNRAYLCGHIIAGSDKIALTWGKNNTGTNNGVDESVGVSGNLHEHTLLGLQCVYKSD